MNISDDDRIYLDELMKEWSSLQTQLEERRFSRQAEIEEGSGPDFDTDEEHEAYKFRQTVFTARMQGKIDAIEIILNSHGARVMRPYEHWNEEERLMEYLERERMKIAYDTVLKRPGCVLIQAGMGATVRGTDFPSDCWLVYMTPDMKLYEISEEQYRMLVKYHQQGPNKVPTKVP